MKKLLLSIVAALLILSSCTDNKPANDYCVVKGTVKGIKEGKKLDLLDAFNDWVVVGQVIIKDGAFEIHPEVTSPTLVKIYEKYHDKGLEIYGLSVDTQKRYKYWKSCIEKNNMTWVNVCDYSGGKRGNSKVRDDYALIAYPTTILIDCQTGKIVMRDDIENIVSKLAELLQ
ncbi:MAG: redoxin domain-containing protein [Bacteroidales bacterium]|nr:redoxin domain-containing protein [Bacteroidales bacterium]